MPFPKKSLNADESVALDLHPHWWYFAEPALALLGVIILSILLYAKGPKGTGGDVLGVIDIAALVVTGVWLLLRYLKWVTTHFVITSQRVVFRTGVLAKSGIEIPLDRVNNVNFNQSIFERMLGAGDLLIESGGEDGQQRFTDVRKPQNVQNLIQAQVEAKNRQRAGYAPPGVAAPVDVAGQLEKLEGLLQRGSLTQEEFDAQKARLLGG